MKQEEIGAKINPSFPNVYAPTKEATKLLFVDGTVKVGYFQRTSKSDLLEKENKYTFIEYGENAQNYRATQDEKYTITINGDDIINVEYPSYSPVLLAQLKKIRNVNAHDETDWEEYKNKWKIAVDGLINTLVHKWLHEYEESGLMQFTILPVKRIEPKLGEYHIMMLEISLSDNRSLVLEPVAGITSEYNGRLDFYMRGNVYKKYTILRKVIDNKDSWILAKSYDPRDYFILDKSIIENTISIWLQ